MSIQKVFLPGAYFATEGTQTVFTLSGAAIAISAGVATVTLASHLLATGNLVTFSGVTGTGVTFLNNAVWGPITVTNSGVYTFPCNLVGTAGGTIVQNGPLYFPPSGTWIFTLGANGILEYNPNNLLGQNSMGGLPVGNIAPTAGTPQDTWRQLAAASTTGLFVTDGFSIRFRPNGTTATSRFSLVS